VGGHCGRWSLDNGEKKGADLGSGAKIFGRGKGIKRRFPRNASKQRKGYFPRKKPYSTRMRVSRKRKRWTVGEGKGPKEKFLEKRSVLGKSPGS